MMEKARRVSQTLDMSAAEFRKAGHELVDSIANFIETLPHQKVTPGEDPGSVRRFLKHQSLPESGAELREIVDEASTLLFEHSLFNGHPRFWGYITSSAAPIGTLAEMIATAVNPNVGAFILSPMATEIELQTIRWLAELIGYDPACGGVFVSGGNMANFIGFLSARKYMIKSDIRKEGLPVESISPALNEGGIESDTDETLVWKDHIIYCAMGTHTWIHKAADLFGFGTDSIRWIPGNEKQQMDVTALRREITKDIEFGHVPFLVIGNAGSVATGVVDPLDEISGVCKEMNLWFHVDGAYGAPAAALPENRELFKALSEADSIAIDPHKWLYSPLEAGCILVKSKQHLYDAFSFNPDYYNFRGNGEEPLTNFHELSMQNSRGFKALKVWMSLKQTGKNGLVEMIRKDIRLAKSLFDLVSKTESLEAISQNLSITTFRFIPPAIPETDGEQYINTINEKLLNRLQKKGDVFLSNAVIHGKYCLRVCIVNFRTTDADIEFLVSVVLQEGMALSAE